MIACRARAWMTILEHHGHGDIHWDWLFLLPEASDRRRFDFFLEFSRPAVGSGTRAHAVQNPESVIRRPAITLRTAPGTLLQFFNFSRQEDHRLQYMHFRGRLTGNRGYVTPVVLCRAIILQFGFPGQLTNNRLRLQGPELQIQRSLH